MNKYRENRVRFYKFMIFVPKYCSCIIRVLLFSLTNIYFLQKMYKNEQYQ